MKEYTLLMRLDHASKDLAESLYNFGKDWPLFRDHKFKLIDAEEYKAMVSRGELTHSDFWVVSKYGFVMLKSGTTYSTTYEKLKQGLNDFMDGWNAAMKQANPTMECGRFGYYSWNEGIVIPKRTKRVKLGRLSYKF